METVYIVTSGEYSYYHIEAVFKNKSKAETYCSCHRNCEIEEYDFSDNEIYTTFNIVSIEFKINHGRDEINFNFEQLAKDCCYTERNYDYVSVSNRNHIYISLTRLLPNNYNEQAIRDKYTKVYQDLKAEILYMVSEHDFSTYEKVSQCNKDIKEFIKGKFGIEMDDE